MENVVVFASGTGTGGGSGFARLVKFSQNTSEDTAFRIVGVVSNISDGGVEERAANLDVPFMHLPHERCTPEGYASVAEHFGKQNLWYACSGWRLPVIGLEPARTFNIRPALCRQHDGVFCAPDMHGHYVHEVVRKALDADELGETPRTGVTMHFMPKIPAPKINYKLIFAEIPVNLEKGMPAEDIRKRVSIIEHRWQPILTQMVVTRQIRLEEGKVVAPIGYGLLPKILDPLFV